MIQTHGLLFLSQVINHCATTLDKGFLKRVVDLSRQDESEDSNDSNYDTNDSGNHNEDVEGNVNVDVVVDVNGGN